MWLVQADADVNTVTVPAGLVARSGEATPESRTLQVVELTYDEMHWWTAGRVGPLPSSPEDRTEGGCY